MKNEKLSLDQVNTFLQNHTSADFFDVDAKLFMEKYPDSKLIPIIKNAAPFQKAQLDERICAEMLMHGDACIDCIWNNRGFFVNAKGAVLPLGKSGKIELKPEEKQLLDTDLEKANYNEMKKLMFALNLEPKKGDKDAYFSALNHRKHELLLLIEDEKTSDNMEAGDTGTGDETHTGRTEGDTGKTDTDNGESGNTGNAEGGNTEGSNEGNGETGSKVDTTTSASTTDPTTQDAEKKSEGQESSTQA